MNDNTNFINNVYSLITSTNTPNLGELLIRKSEEIGISQRKLCEILKLERKSLERILKGEAQKVDVVMFLKISQFLELDFHELLQIYVSKLDPENIKEIETARRASFILQNFNLDSLKKINFIKNKNNLDEVEQRIKAFFGLKSLFEYSNLSRAAFFSRTKRNFSDKMLRFWISGAHYQIKKIENPYPYDRKLLLNIIPKLPKLTRDEENGLLRAAKVLFEAGITVIFQTYITGIQIRGATFINSKRPYIILTDFNKNYATVWFALFHELYHVLKDFTQIEDMNYHITGQSDIFFDSLAEESANDFARQVLFSNDKMEYIKSFIDIPTMVEQFAETTNIHPAIIYSFYSYDHRDNKELVSKLKYISPNPNKSLQKLFINPWEKEDLEKIAEEVNSIYNSIN